MATIVASLYESHATAATVVEDLVAAGIARPDIALVSGADRQIGGQNPGGADLVERLTACGIAPEDARALADGIANGAALVTAAVPDAEAVRMAGILGSHNPLDNIQNKTTA